MLCNGQELILSKYAFVLDGTEGQKLLFSSLTGVIIAFYDQVQQQKIKKILDQELIKYHSDDEMVQLLYDKGILIEKDFDENILVRYSYELNVVRDRKLMLMLVVTRQCNFRCIYCSQEHVNLIMTRSTFDSIYLWLEQLFERKEYQHLELSFFGGEPLLEYDNIVYFLEKLKAMLDRNGATYTASMTTNGYVLTPERFEVLARLHCLGYQITIDGMDVSHNKTRFLIGGQPTWEVIMNNLKYMSKTEHPFAVTLRTNYNEDVYESLILFYEYVKNNFDQRFHIYFETIKKQGGKNDSQFDVFDIVSSVATDAEIIRILKDSKLYCSNIWDRTTPSSLMCYASKPNFFTIDYDGSVKKCSHILDDESNRIGMLYENGDLEIDNKKHSLWVSNDYTNSKVCMECKLLPLCFGKKCIVSKMRTGQVNCNPAVETVRVEEILSSYF